jgi:hypothetical protein
MLQQQSSRSVSGTVVGQKIDLGIETSGLAKIMDLLTDLYEDPIKAIIREYSTNAADSHKQAGQTRPIEVVLPGAFDPTFRVKDFGVGMTVEDIIAIYSNYGASTKDKSNDQTGMFGIGGKCALAYSDSFTVTTTVDGVQATLFVGRDESGAGSMTVVDTRQTNRENGVEIAVPVRRHDVETFRQRAAHFFSVWTEGVLVDGHAPKPPDNVLKLSDRFWLYKSFDRYTAAPSLAVMGNVPYPISTNFSLPHGWGVVAFVPMGALDIPPNREGVKLTPKTISALNALVPEYTRTTQGHLQKMVDAEPTHEKALAAILEWGAVLNSNGLTYRGVTVPMDYRLPNNTSMLSTDLNGYTLSNSSRVVAWDRVRFQQTLWLHGWDAASMSASHKRKMQKYCRDNGIDARWVVLTTHKPDSPWLPADLIKPWADVKAVKLPRAVTTRSGFTRIPGSYDVYDNGSFKSSIEADDLDTSKPLLYHVGRRYEVGGFGVLKLLEPKYTIVVLPRNRVDKFKRDFPMAAELNKHLEALYVSWSKGLSKQDIDGLCIEDSRYAKVFDRMSETEVDDPALKAAIKASKALPDKVSALSNAFYQALYKRPALNVTWTNPLLKYPLFNGAVLDQNPDHIYTYINAAYAAKGGSK